MRKLLIYPNIKIVKGATYDALIDLQRSNIFHISKDFSTFFEKYSGKSKEELYDEVDDYGEIENFILKNNLGAYYDTLHRFDYSTYSFLEKTSFSLIDTVRICYDEDKAEELDEFVFQVKKIGAKYVSIVLDRYSPRLISLLRLLLKEQFSCVHLEFKSHIREEICYDIIYDFPFVAMISVFSSETGTSHIKFEKPYNSLVSYTIENFESINHYKFDIENISFNQKSYLIAQEYHPYFYKRLEIDFDGNIKNHISFKDSYGNIYSDRDVDLKDVIETSGICHLWNLSRDKIEPCNNCEFRYVCNNFSYINNKNELQEECNYFHSFINKSITELS